MEDKTLIQKITIPKYIREIKISNKQREKYYEWDGTTIKSGSKKLLQKYIKPSKKQAIILNNGNVLPQDLKPEYTIIGFKGTKIYCQIGLNGIAFLTKLTDKQLEKPTKFILCHNCIADGYPKVIANEAKAGTAKYHIIRGQDFYVGLNPHTRNKIVHTLKESYYHKLMKHSEEVLLQVANRLQSSYPLIIEMEIRDTVKNMFGRVAKAEDNPGHRWDVGNRAEPYMKTFLDFLTNGYKDEDDNLLFPSLIEDDDRLHISSGNNAYFTPIDNTEDRALVFYIYKDTRPIWKKWFNLYKKYV